MRQAYAESTRLNGQVDNVQDFPGFEAYVNLP